MTTLPNLLVLPPTPAGRCDRCPAAAQVRAVLPAGELLFWGHHARAYRTRLLEIGTTLTSRQRCCATTAERTRDGIRDRNHDLR
jgi:hypothetical protein